MGEPIIEGILTSGLGKGAVFMSIDYYKHEFKTKLGLEAFKGTLNLIVDKKQADLFKNLKPIRIEGIKKEDRTFGGVSCYSAKLKDINGFVIIPDLSEHEDIIEFISTPKVRSDLGLKDGDKIKIELTQ